MTTKLLGKKSQRGNYPLRVLLMTPPEATIALFESRHEYAEWSKDITRIRQSAFDINERNHSIPNISDEEEEAPYRNIFLPMVSRFKTRWGSDMVPQDVRNSVRSVEVGIGVEVTEWPVFETIG